MLQVIRDVSSFVGDWGQVIGSLFTALAFWLALLQFRRSDRIHRRTERETLETRQVEIYQRLELESMAVFRFETEHRSILPFYKLNLAPALASPSGIDMDEAELTARKYYEITCNIFEIAVRLRVKSPDYIEDEVFGSWVAWFFDTACEWGFRAVWHDLRDNYTSQLRCEVFDPIVRELIALWDKPHATDPREELTISEDDIDPIRRRFYQEVGERFGCESALCWVNDIRQEPFPQHPRAYA